jgi:hypothetical protein
LLDTGKLTPTRTAIFREKNDQLVARTDAALTDRDRLWADSLYYDLSSASNA